MAGVARSATLAAYRFAAAGNQFLVTCPSGITLLLKSMGITSWASSSATVNAYIVRSSPQAAAVIHAGALAAGANFWWDGWAVLSPGDKVQVSVDQVPIDVWLSGSVLQGVAVIPPSMQVLPSPIPLPPLSTLVT